MKKIEVNFPEAKLIGVNGIELEVFEAGIENKGNPIILCHGWPELAYSWRYQVDPFVQAGYHVIIPNQRGYGNSSIPSEVTEYDISHLTGDLVALLDYYNYEEAIFVGHDWGANVVWGLTLLHPSRVSKVINLSVPYFERGEKPWIEFMEEIFGEDDYFVHFNRKPGVADVIFEENTKQFLSNLYRKNIPVTEPKPGMRLINLAMSKKALGEVIMSDSDIDVFVSAFNTSGFSGSVNWYRNLDRNWHILGEVDPIIQQPALMIYGSQDMVQQSPNLTDFVPNVDIVTLECGHWIQEEKPEETNKTILEWLGKWKN